MAPDLAGTLYRKARRVRCCPIRGKVPLISIISTKLWPRRGQVSFK